jgi:glycerate dehydrogenase
MHHIVFLDRGTIAPHIRLRRPGFEHLWTQHDRTGVADLVQRLRRATIAIDNKVPLRRETLLALPDLKLVAMAATGTDCVDVDCCRERGIVVSNIRGYANHTVPEHVFALVLALRRGILGYREDVRRGAWQEAGQFCFWSHPIDDLHGSTIGIIGEGALGQRVGELARAFGMKVLFAAHKGKSGLGPLYTPFAEVLANADVISLHCPLLPETRNLIGIDEFRQMKRRPVLINAARGGLVVEADLAQALDEALIAGAAFDVASAEPPPPDSVLMQLAGRHNVIVTPHIAWASSQAQQALADQLIDNIERFADGRPANVVQGVF